MVIELKNKRREFLIKERKHIPKIMKSWILLKTFMTQIKQLAHAYNVKSQSKKRINKFLTLFSICSRFLAKMVMKWRIRRDNRIVELMTKIIRTHKHHWRFQRQFKNKKRIGEFLYIHKYAVPLLLVVKCTIRSIIKIQKWYKWNYQKRCILLGLMLRQWSAIEHVVDRFKASLTDKQIYNLVQVSIKKRSVSKFTSRKFRIQIIETYLAVYLFIH